MIVVQACHKSRKISVGTLSLVHRITILMERHRRDHQRLHSRSTLECRPSGDDLGASSLRWADCSILMSFLFTRVPIN